MSGGRTYQIKLSDDVIKTDIPTLDAEIKRRAKQVIEDRLTTDPVRHGKPLKHSLKGHRSVRVGGGYRIVYKIEPDERTVYILAIAKRENVYSKGGKRIN